MSATRHIDWLLRLERGFHCVLSAPLFKAAIHTVDLIKSLLVEIGGGALAGVAVVAVHDKRQIGVSLSDNILQCSGSEVIRAR